MLHPVYPKNAKHDPTQPDIVIKTSGDQGTSPEDYKVAAEYMRGLADRSGGRLYETMSLAQLKQAYAHIAAELREFYSIGYYPTGDRLVDKTTNVKIKVMRDGLVVHAASSS